MMVTKLHAVAESSTWYSNEKFDSVLVAVVTELCLVDAAVWY